MEQSPRLSLSYVAPSQAQKHVTVNETFRRLDALVQAVVRSRTASSEPASPAEGDAYIIPASATGAIWGAFDEGDLAAYQDGAWARVPPFEGLRVWVADDDEFAVYDGAAWGALSGGGASETAAKFGINATADATNKLSVKSDAVLFSHDDITPGSGDAQIKINKAAAGDTASHLFQTNFSGRAEFGLTGDDDFHVKVSADGSAWTEALFIDKDDGKVGIGTTAPAAEFEVHLSGGVTDAGLISSDNILLTGEDNAQSFAGIVASSASSAHRMVFKGTRCRGDLNAPAACLDGDAVFTLIGAFYDGAAVRASASIEMAADGTISSGNAPQRITFWTGPTTSRSERVRITSAGRVGIGEASPDALLHVDGGGVLVGNPTGGDKGAGTINAQAVYDNNTLLSCYVFDQALDGFINQEKWDAKTPDRIAPAEVEHRIDPATGEVEIVERAPAKTERRRHEPMRKFAGRIGTEHDPLTLDGYAKHWKEKRHLTALPDEAAFDPVNGQLTTGEWIQRLVETVEIQAVLIEELNQRTKTQGKT
ncbi:DUF2793 domain-containing protein [Hyphococcus sp.]|jgi:hypothetical protein|uniref:DUF2793 domain-containing protein n=1 Tax=Hyphococcus sp. TaxID=2038636 RepID=UPI003D129DB1